MGQKPAPQSGQRFELWRFVRRRALGWLSNEFNSLWLPEDVWGDPDLFVSLFPG